MPFLIYIHSNFINLASKFSFTFISRIHRGILVFLWRNYISFSVMDAPKVSGPVCLGIKMQNKVVIKCVDWVTAIAQSESNLQNLGFYFTQSYGFNGYLQPWLFLVFTQVVPLGAL